MIWDVKQPGLALWIRTTGKKSFKVVYRFHGRPRWLHLGDVRSIGLADARRLAAKIVLDVIDGKDPVAERMAERASGTFADLASQYVELARQEAQQELEAGRAPGGASSAAALGQAQGQRHHPRRRAGDDGADRRADPRQPDARGGLAVFSWAVRQEILTDQPVSWSGQKSDRRQGARAVRRRDQGSVREP